MPDGFLLPAILKPCQNKEEGSPVNMGEPIILRAYQETDRNALEGVIREAWDYDRFCSPKTAAKLAAVYLNSCLIHQTFTRVAERGGEPVGIIMGNDLRHRKCSVSLTLRWLLSLLSLCSSKEGREVANLFASVQGMNQALLSACGKEYQGELTFFVIKKACRGQGLGRTLFQTVVDFMKANGISSFYLFTDTSCNYKYYEHFGLTRCCEKHQPMERNGETGDMTFFLYAYPGETEP